MIDDATRQRVRRDPLIDHPDSPLARYIASEYGAARERKRLLNPPPVGDHADGFIHRLAEFRRQYMTVVRSVVATEVVPTEPDGAVGASGDDPSTTPAGDDGKPPSRPPLRLSAADRTALQQYTREATTPHFAARIAELLARLPAVQGSNEHLADAVRRLRRENMLVFAVQYQLATEWARAGQRQRARAWFVDLYRRALEYGVVPPVGIEFRDVLRKRATDEEEPVERDPFGDSTTDNDDPFGPPSPKPQGEDPFASAAPGQRALGPLETWESTDPDETFFELFRATCRQFVEQGRYRDALRLTWQAERLGERALALELFQLTVENLPENERPDLTLEAIDFLVHSGRGERAARMLEKLCNDPEFEDHPALWKLASWHAGRRGLLAQSIRFHERALDLKYAQAETINLKQAGREHQLLFGRYRQLCRALAALEQSPGDDLTRRVVAAADRWRKLLPPHGGDSGGVCATAAEVLELIGRDQLAWDYLVTPLAWSPNEAAPWLKVARTQKTAGRIGLADRAYRQAFAAESTDASILWEHAHMLEQSGKTAAARKIFQKLADGRWQERFRRFQREARERLE